MNKLQAAEQFRKALQMFAASLSDERAMEVATIYDAWAVGKHYAVGEFVTYGENRVGDPQLYKVVQPHVSNATWTPNVTRALFTPIGLDDNGYPVWSQPTGAHDAYNIGDVVDYNGTLYESTIDGNVYAPDAYPAGWRVYNG
jgi:chitodextrinase